MSSSITLNRDVDAIAIPSGEHVILEAGGQVSITQSLGGFHTLMTPRGMYRVAEKDGDALGLEVKKTAGEGTKAPAADVPKEEVQSRVWDALKTVYDPEIPVNIVDLGLVYTMEMLDNPGGGHNVEVKMTLTAPGCGMGPTIQADARSRVLAVLGVAEAQVELVWDPPWNQDMISEEGKMKLGMI